MIGMSTVHDEASPLVNVKASDAKQARLVELLARPEGTPTATRCPAGGGVCNRGALRPSTVRDPMRIGASRSRTRPICWLPGELGLRPGARGSVCAR